eukprot:jgi/Mesvir1/1060/Mv25691-RA.1
MARWPREQKGGATHSWPALWMGTAGLLCGWAPLACSVSGMGAVRLSKGAKWTRIGADLL